MIKQIADDYKRADPGHASFFDAQQQRFEVGRPRYHRPISLICSRYGGQTAGASQASSRRSPPPAP